MPGIRTIKTVFTGDARGLIEAGKQGEKAVSGWQSGIGKASTAILAATAAAGAGLLSLGKQFDDAYDTIRTTTGKSGEALKGLQEDFKAVAKRVPADLGTVSQAIAELNQRTGATGPQLQELAEQIIQLARLTNTDLNSVIATSTRLFGDWGITVEEQSETLDKVFRASQQTGVGVTDLMDTVVAFGAPLRQLGFTFDESIAMLAKWEKEGVNTELVLGGLKKALGSFAKEGDDPVVALQAFTDAIKNAGSTAEANQIAVEQLGVRAGPDFAAAVREGRLELGTLLTEVQGGAETIKGTADQTADFSEKLQQLKNKAFVALEPAANAVFEKMNELAGSLESAGEWASKNQGTVKNLVVGLGALAATVVAINAALKVYAAVQAIVKAATVVWTGVQWALNVALNANPIGLVILAIAALVAGIILLWNNSDAFREFFINLWEDIWGILKAIGGWFAGPFKDFFVNGFNNVVKGARMVLDYILAIPGKIGQAFLSIAEFIGRPFRAAFNFVADAWNNTIGRLSWTVPGWVPVVGGKTISAPKLPKFHQGGVMPGPLGAERLALLQAGEEVLTRNDPRHAANGGGDVHLTVPIDLGEGVVRVVNLVIDRRNRVVRNKVRAVSGVR